MDERTESRRLAGEIIDMIATTIAAARPLPETRPCLDCAGAGEQPDWLTYEMDTGMWAYEDTVVCERCDGTGTGDAARPLPETRPCLDCAGAGEMMVGLRECTDTGWWEYTDTEDCERCDATGFETAPA